VWDDILETGPEQYARLLLRNDDIGKAIRRTAPFYVILDAEQRRTLLRTAAYGSSNGSAWRERWSGSENPTNIVDAIEIQLTAAFEPKRQLFCEFLTAVNAGIKLTHPAG
jgi:hypothetical protein